MGQCGGWVWEVNAPPPIRECIALNIYIFSLISEFYGCSVARGLLFPIEWWESARAWYKQHKFEVEITPWFIISNWMIKIHKRPIKKVNVKVKLLHPQFGSAYLYTYEICIPPPNSAAQIYKRTYFLTVSRSPRYFFDPWFHNSKWMRKLHDWPKQKVVLKFPWQLPSPSHFQHANSTVSITLKNSGVNHLI